MHTDLGLGSAKSGFEPQERFAVCGSRKTRDSGMASYLTRQWVTGTCEPLLGGRQLGKSQVGAWP